MFTDIVGFTSIMSFNEPQAISTLEIKDQLLQKFLDKYNGKLIKKIGDGTLSIFDSSIDAVKCGQDLIESINLECNFKIRIGIHLGEVVLKNNDIYGEGVNIASRLEGIAQPDSIIISKDIYNQLTNHQEFNPVSIGVHSIKGIGRVIELFLLSRNNQHGTYLMEKLKEVSPEKEQSRHSIGVLLFNNLGDKKDEYYSYGITHDLISELSISQKFLIKYIDDYNFKLIDPELSQAIKNKYNIEFIINGSLWKRNELFQLNVNLLDVERDTILWSDHWYEDWDKLPILKDKIADGIFNVFQFENQRTTKVCKTIPTITEAYRIYLEAKHLFNHRQSTTDSLKVEHLLRKSIDLDEKMINSKILLGELFASEGEYSDALLYLKKCLKQCKIFHDKPRMSICLNNIGDILFELGKLDEAFSFQKEALGICESIDNIKGMGYVLNSIGNIYSMTGDIANAEKQLLNSLEIREMMDNELNTAITLGNLSLVFMQKLEYEKAIQLAKQSLTIREAINDHHGIGIIKNIMANICTNMNELENAEKYINESIEKKLAINDKHGLIISFNSMGNVHAHNKNMQLALMSYKEALDLSCEIKNLPEYCESVENIANIYLQISENELAYQALTKSLKIRNLIGYKETIINTENKICMLNKGKRTFSIKNSIKHVNYPNLKRQSNLPVFNIDDLGFVSDIKIDLNPEKISNLNQTIKNLLDYQF